MQLSPLSNIRYVNFQPYQSHCAIRRSLCVGNCTTEIFIIYQAESLLCTESQVYKCRKWATHTAIKERSLFLLVWTNYEQFNTTAETFLVSNMLPSRQVGDMYKGVIETGKDVCNTKVIFPFCQLRSKRYLLLFSGLLFSRRHLKSCIHHYSSRYTNNQDNHLEQRSLL